MTSSLSSSDHFLSILQISTYKCATRLHKEDEGRPLGVGLQEQTSNRLKLHG